MSPKMPHQTMSLTTVSLVVLLVISQLEETTANAKNGNQASKKCQQYGHSCLGGHGKRSSSQNVAIPFMSTGSRVVPYRALMELHQQLQQRLAQPDFMPSESKATIGHMLRMPLVYSLQSLPKADAKQPQKNLLLDGGGQSLESSNDYVWESDVPSTSSSMVTDPDSELRENLLALLNSPMGHHISHHLPLSVLKKLNISQRPVSKASMVPPMSIEYDDISSGQEWELLSPMKKAAASSGAGHSWGRIRRSIQKPSHHLSKASTHQAPKSPKPLAAPHHKS